MTPAEQMREAAAQDVACACAARDAVLEAKTRIERARLCGQPICGAEQARSIRALPLPADPVRDALVEALRDIGRQKMHAERTEDEDDDGDLDHALDECIRTARAALILAGETS